uniref:Uncharacterized protein n=1 Tax=Knipowitschia caucasica TaxID=637954 RepID=A0AAV2LM33_KNICA
MGSSTNFSLDLVPDVSPSGVTGRWENHGTSGVTGLWENHGTSQVTGRWENHGTSQVTGRWENHGTSGQRAEQRLRGSSTNFGLDLVPDVSPSGVTGLWENHGTSGQRRLQMSPLVRTMALTWSPYLRRSNQDMCEKDTAKEMVELQENPAVSCPSAAVSCPSAAVSCPSAAVSCPSAAVCSRFSKCESMVHSSLV